MRPGAAPAHERARHARRLVRPLASRALRAQSENSGPLSPPGAGIFGKQVSPPSSTSFKYMSTCGREENAAVEIQPGMHTGACAPAGMGPQLPPRPALRLALRAHRQVAVATVGGALLRGRTGREGRGRSGACAAGCRLAQFLAPPSQLLNVLPCFAAHLVEKIILREGK